MTSLLKKPVLDKGFVTLIDSMGSDLSVVNAARISYGKQKDVFDAKDEILVKYLAEHEHQSPFRHAYITLHIKAPIFVFRQWMKHQIGCSFNELSMRYAEVTEDDFYLPEIFREQAVVNKQGSHGIVSSNESAKGVYRVACEKAVLCYKQLLEQGVCREQARCVLPVAMYSEVYWTTSLQAVAHFIRLRTDSHAQWEIQQYANAVKDICIELYPISLLHLLESKV